MPAPVGAEMIRALALRDSGEHLGIASGPGKPGLFADVAEISEHGAQRGFGPGFGQLLATGAEHRVLRAGKLARAAGCGLRPVSGCRRDPESGL